MIKSKFRLTLQKPSFWIYSKAFKNRVLFNLGRHFKCFVFWCVWRGGHTLLRAKYVKAVFKRQICLYLFSTIETPFECLFFLQPKHLKFASDYAVPLVIYLTDSKPKKAFFNVLHVNKCFMLYSVVFFNKDKLTDKLSRKYNTYKNRIKQDKTKKRWSANTSVPN